MPVSFKINVGRYVQTLSYGEEAREFSLQNLFFETKEPVRCESISFGIEGSLGYLVDYDIEFYSRSLTNITRFKTIFPEFEYGQGRVTGFDVFLKKRTGFLTYQITYCYLKTQAAFGGYTSPFDWEARHTVNGLAGIQLGKEWFWNFLLTFRSGLPITPIIGKYEKVVSLTDETRPYRSLKNEYIEGPRNSARLPDYLRIDLSIRKKFFKKNFNYMIYLQIINVLNRSNPLRYDWNAYYQEYYLDEEGNKRRGGEVRSLPLVPSIGVQFEI